MLLRIYRKYKHIQTKDVKDLKDRQILLSAFPMLNGSKVTTSMSLWMNFVGLGRIAIFSLFKNSTRVFGAVFMAYNITTTYLVFKKYIQDHKYYTKLSFPFFCLAMIFEGLFFFCLGLASLK
jgi:hypothetical protein